MYPILGRFGPFIIYSYEVIMALGIGACIGVAFWLGKHDNQRLGEWLNGIIVAIVLAFAGGRVVFVWIERNYYVENLGDIWLVWRGGLSYHGALLAGLFGLWAWSRWRKQPFANFAGMLAAVLALMTAFGWLACLLEGCAYGRETFLGIISSDLPDSFGVYSVRYHTQLIGLIFSALVFVLIMALYKRSAPLQLFWLAVATLCLGRLVVGLFRGDEAPMIGSLRQDIVVDGVLAAVALISLLLASRSNQKAKDLAGS